jgi:hypothetical protein
MIPDFDTKKELFEHLVENKGLYITQKKENIKYADGFATSLITKIEKATKAEGDTDTELKRYPIINTTNVIDSHKDLHLPGIWSKSLKENKNIYYLQSHKMDFEYVIANPKDVKATAKYYEWKELGFDFEGRTQALVFDVTIKREVNSKMFSQFKDGNVNQNSVGMRYVKIDLAINDEDYDQEFSVWNKYYANIANKEVADSDGYFWAVTEAKVIEGSAVLVGSNQFTPVRESKNEPSKDTQVDINEFKSLIKSCLK